MQDTLTVNKLSLDLCVYINKIHFLFELGSSDHHCQKLGSQPFWTTYCSLSNHVYCHFQKVHLASWPYACTGVFSIVLPESEVIYEHLKKCLSSN